MYESYWDPDANKSTYEILRQYRHLNTDWLFYYIKKLLSFPGGAVVKNLPANAGDTGSRPGPGRSHMLRTN